MNAKKIIAPDMRNALKKVRAVLGEDAVILSHRKVANGIELIVSDSPVEEVVASLEQQATIQKNQARWYHDKTLDEQTVKNQVQRIKQNQNNMVSQKTVVQKKASEKNASGKKVTDTITSHEAAFSKLNPKTLDSQKSSEFVDTQVVQLESEVAWLRGLLDSQAAVLNWGHCQAHHPIKTHVLQRLSAIGLSAQVSKQLTQEINESDIQLAAVWQQVIKQFANQMTVFPQELIVHKGIYALLGPTGSGKTTSIAKIAARFVQQNASEQIGLISLDTVRMGASHQLTMLSQILNVSVRFCSSTQDVQSAMAAFSDRQLVLVDTAGLPFNDRAWQVQQSMLESMGESLNCLMTVACTHQQSVVSGYLNQLRTASHCKITGAILTKLDEACRLGEALSFILEHQLSLAYVTHGLSLIEDLSFPEPLKLIRKALELSQGMQLSDIEMTSVIKNLLAPEQEGIFEKMAG